MIKTFAQVCRTLVPILNPSAMKLKCLVIDDDPLICDLLQHFCSKIKQIDFCLAADNAMDGLNLLTSQPFDLLFLDYNLPDISGQSFLEMKQNLTPVVMITSHASFAADSYNYRDVVDFIVKPVTFDRFYRSVERVLEGQSKPMTDPEPDTKVLFVKDGNKLMRLHFAEVGFIKSESNYVVFNLGGKQIMSLIALKDLAKKLPANFVRIHRSYMVNINKIDYITSEEVVVMHNTLPIGSKYKPELMSKITEL